MYLYIFRYCYIIFFLYIYISKSHLGASCIHARWGWGRTDVGLGWSLPHVKPAAQISPGGLLMAKYQAKMDLLLKIMWGFLLFFVPMEGVRALQAKLIKFFFINNMVLSRSLAVENGFQDSGFHPWGEVCRESWSDPGGLFSLPFPWASVSSHALCLILCRIFGLGFGELSAPQNLSQRHRCTPILQQERRSIKTSPQFCVVTVLQRIGFLCTGEK